MAPRAAASQARHQLPSLGTPHNTSPILNLKQHGKPLDFGLFQKLSKCCCSYEPGVSGVKSSAHRAGAGEEGWCLAG